MIRTLLAALMLAMSVTTFAGPVTAQTPVGSTFTYQGRLTDGGQPYNGTADLTFRLFDAETGGNPIGPIVAISGRLITNGLLTVDLDFGPGAFAGDERWLNLAVNGVPLTPRQPIRPAPYALYAANAPTAGGSLWQEALAGIYYDSGNVGIGTFWPAQRLDVRGQIQVQDSIRLDVADEPMIVRQFDPMTSGRLEGFGRWGMFMEPHTLVLGIPGPDVGPRFLRVSSWNLDGTREDWLSVDNNGSVTVDPANANDGASLNSPGLKFGSNSGEGIASKRTPGDGRYGLDFYTGFTKRVSITQGGNLELLKADGSVVHRMASNHMISTYGGDGTEKMRLWSDSWGGLFLWDSSHDNTVQLSAGDESGGELFLRNGSGTTTITLDADYGGSGRVTTQVLAITGGSDLSEQFDVTTADGRIDPGMVVCIARHAPGKLVVSSKARDRTVAGVLSGAGGVRTGMMMSQSGSIADGEHPVALSGRVWTWCDVSNGAIEPGDLLTTSANSGHAMRVTNHEKANGAILGKAMTSLDTDTGLVLVLVSLQ